MRFPTVKAPEGSKNFLKIKDGESVRGVFVGEFYHFYQKWMNGKSIICEEGDADGKVRFRCNFVTADERNELTAKIWEFPYSVYEQLKGINDDYELDKTKVKVTRSGTGTDTTYQVIPLAAEKDKLTGKHLEAIAQVPLHPLEKKGAPQGGPTAQFNQPEAGDEIPF